MADDFAKKVTAFAEKAKAAQLEVFKQAVIEVGTRLIEATPMETGRARGSWESTIGEPASGESPDRSPGEAITELRAMAENLTLQDVANITSGLYYMPTLEYGSSRQPPHGMVRLIAQQWPQIVREAAAKVKSQS